MINVESQIYTKIVTALRVSYPTIDISSVTTYAPAVFPHVSIEEVDNKSYRKTRDTGSNEKHVEVHYEVNVFTNLQTGSKSQAKGIFAVIDNAFNKLGFTRTSVVPIVLDDASKYRLTARFRALIDTNEVIYRR